MGMMQYMDLDTLHNLIALDNTKSSVNIIVEGATDATLFEGFVDEELCNIYYVSKKSNVIDLMQTLELENKNGYTVAIVDDDHDAMFGVKRPANTFRTDTNDIETMIFFSDAFYNIARQLLPYDKVGNKAAIDDIRKQIITWSLPIGFARILSKRNQWNLCFKENQHGTKLEFKKIFDRKNLTYKGDSTLIEVLRNHIRIHEPDNKAFLEKLRELIKERIAPVNIIVGHDIGRIMELAIENLWKKKENVGMTKDNIEIVFRTAYTKDLFAKTRLYNKLVNAIPQITYI